MKNVITRIAPSPSKEGFFHIGNARTALFNFLYAKHMGGKFLLRIEDTDKEKISKESVDAILNGLKWLGLDYDGEPVFQSANVNRHIEVANELLARGMAYRCYLSPEGAAAHKKNGVAFRSPWRDIKTEGLSPAPFVVRFKGPQTGETVINDLVKGEVRFANENLDDLVLLRSDGSPTYNLAVVVDDYDSGVNTIIRGDDHMNNTPRQALIYAAMGWDLPAFGHIPLIFTEAGKKMSKRNGDAGLMDYATAGYLPETMRNYLTHLGWGHGDSDIFTDAEAIEWFDIKDVVSSPARFDTKKLNSINQHYINTLHDDVLVALMMPLLDKRIPDIERPYNVFKNAFRLMKAGAKTLVDLMDMTEFVFRLPDPFEDKAITLLKDDTALANLRWVKSTLDPVKNDWWTVDHLNHLIHDQAEQHGLKMKDIGPVLRAALTGRTSAPDLGTCLYLIGHDESLARIRAWL